MGTLVKQNDDTAAQSRKRLHVETCRGLRTRATISCFFFLAPKKLWQKMCQQKNVAAVQMPLDPKYLPMTNTALLIAPNIPVNVYLSNLSNPKHHSEDDNIKSFFLQISFLSLKTFIVHILKI